MMLKKIELTNKYGEFINPQDIQKQINELIDEIDQHIRLQKEVYKSPHLPEVKTNRIEERYSSQYSGG